MGWFIAGLIALFSTFSTVIAVSAAPVTFVVEGTIGSPVPSFDAFEQPIGAGTSFTGQITFEDTVVDQRPDRPLVGVYRMEAEPTRLEVTIAGLTFAHSMFTIQVNSVDPNSYFVYAHTPFAGPSATQVQLLAFELRFGPPNLFLNDSLPLTPPVPTLFQQRDFTLVVTDSAGKYGPTTITGQIDALTLAPKKSAVPLGKEKAVSPASASENKE